MPAHPERITELLRRSYYKALDTDLIRTVLGEQLKYHLGSHVRVIAISIPRVIPRGKGGLIFQYNIFLEEEKSKKRELTLYGHLPGPNEKYHYYSANSDSVISLEEPRMFIPVFPYDPELPHLPDLFSKSTVNKLLRKCLNIDDSISVAMENTEVMAYRLGRRCVVKYDINIGDGNRTKIMAKLTKQNSANDSISILQQLESAGFNGTAPDSHTVPHYYCHDSASGTYLMEFVAGDSVYDLIGTPDFIEGARAAGEILRKLHETKINISAIYKPSDELRNLEKFSIAGEIFPELGLMLDRIHTLLAKRVNEYEGGYIPLLSHRDFYDKQVLYSYNRITLLDCENMSLADPALDFANFQAHMKLRTLQRPENAAILSSGGEVFTSGYKVEPAMSAERISWWQASALARLACLYALRPRWSSLAHPLADEALRLLN